MQSRRNDGWVGWLVVVMVIVGWDVYALRSDGQTMTDWWRQTLRRHPLLGLLLWLVGGTVGGHLFLKPKWFRRVDVIHLLGKLS